MGDHRGVPPLVVGTAPITHDIDVSRYTVKGQLLIQGAPSVENAGCTGNAARILVNHTFVDVPCGSNFTFGPLSLMPGSHYVMASGTEHSNVPASALGTLVVTGAGDVTVDLVPQHTVTMTLLVNGDAPQAMGCDGRGAARVYLRAPGRDVDIYAGQDIRCGEPFTLALRPTPGTYTLTVDGRDRSTVPLYTHPVPLVVTGDAEILVDVPTRQVSGNIKLDGMLPVETSECTPGQNVAELVLYDLRFFSRDATITTPIPCGANFAFGPVTLAHGVYQVSVRPLGTPARSNLPIMEYVAVPRFVVN